MLKVDQNSKLIQLSSIVTNVVSRNQWRQGGFPAPNGDKRYKGITLNL